MPSATIIDAPSAAAMALNNVRSLLATAGDYASTSMPWIAAHAREAESTLYHWLDGGRHRSIYYFPTMFPFLRRA